MTAQTLTWVRSCAFAMAGLICGLFAITALFAISIMPNWLPLASCLLAALIFFLSAFAAGPERIAISLDDSYLEDRRTAAVLGFWTAMATGCGLWLLNIGGDLQLAITVNLAAACFLLTHVVLEIRGHQ